MAGTRAAPRLSLRRRVAATFGLCSLFVTGVLAAVTWHLASEYMVRQRELSATRQAEVNVRLVDDALRYDTTGLDDLLTGLSTNADATVFLVRDGTWLSSGRPVDRAVVPGSLLAATPDGGPVQDRFVAGGIPVLAVALAVPAGGTFVELFPLLELAGVLRFLGIVLVTGTLVSGVCGAALGLWTSRRALRPLTEMTEVATQVARGDLDARVPHHRDPDLETLATTFNATVEALQERVQRDARFAGDVSHELRSPLTTMANAVEVLDRRRSELPERAGRAVGLLGAEVRRFRRMVVDLLEISREDQPVDDADLEDLDLTELVRKVVEARPDGPPPVEVADGACVRVRGDRRRLDQVVGNLLDNAERYGGGAVRVGVLAVDGRVRLEVDDQGPGVPEDLRRQVFERFARGVRAGRRGDASGTGLGLALVARHVRRHAGAVWVEDRPGGGARFVVELPQAPDGAPG